MARVVTSTVQSDKYNVWIDAEIISQDIASNSSYIVERLYIQRRDGYASSAYNLDSVYRWTQFDWANESGYNGAVDTRNNVLVLLKETYYTVYHDTYGNKTVYLSGGCNQVSSALAAWSIGGYFELTPIPRASQPSASNGTIGSLVPISIARASDSFTHTLKATFGGTT